MLETLKLVVAVFAAIAVIPLFVAFIRNWKLPYFLMLCYLPVSGWIAYRVIGPPGGLLAKDFMFALPAYIGFVVELRKKIRFTGIPQFYSLVASIFCGLVIVQIFNPLVIEAGIGVGIVGARVWLFYMPFMLLTYVILNKTSDFVKLNRTVCATVWIACPIGLIQYMMSVTWGYQKTMTWFYGDQAAAVSQGFANFAIGEGSLVRIPSTFTFVAQYGNFIMGALIFTFLVITVDPSPRWRSFGWATILLLTVAGFLSGTRSIMFLAPAAVMAMFLMQRGMRGILPVIILMCLLSGGVAALTGFSVGDGVGQNYHLIGSNLSSISYGQLTLAVAEAPLGRGTGINTRGTRHFLSMSDQKLSLSKYENSFAKAVIELGILGGLAYFALLLCPLVLSVICYFEFRNPEARAVATACMVYFSLVIIGSTKTYYLDIEPSSIYYWIFVGMIFRLNAFRQKSLTDQAQQALVDDYRSASPLTPY